jgi:polysaccharide biosynthesis/export protein
MRKSTYCLLVSFCVALASFFAHLALAGDAASQARQESLGSASEDSRYVIGKGDVLEINVWREPMLSGEVVVRNDGMISLALAGDVQAAGRTPLDLKAEIEKRLKGYLGEPVVTVILRTAISQKFYVIGEVRTPGEYDLLKEMTIVQGIARAGGFTEWAKKEKIILLRKEENAERRIPVNYQDIMKGKSGSQNVLLHANDTIIVP